jgi:hypothetical protein
MLFAAGAVTRLGRVDDGSTTTDFDPDEIKRKISINTSVAYCDWKGHRINLVDTPGYGDFIADARAGLRVVEAAVVVVDAVAGVQVQTEKVWKFATESHCRASSWSTASTASAPTSSAPSTRLAGGSRGGWSRCTSRSGRSRASGGSSISSR